MNKSKICYDLSEYSKLYLSTEQYHMIKNIRNNQSKYNVQDKS